MTPKTYFLKLLPPSHIAQRDLQVIFNTSSTSSTEEQPPFGVPSVGFQLRHREDHPNFLQETLIFCRPAEGRYERENRAGCKEGGWRHRLGLSA